MPELNLYRTPNRDLAVLLLERAADLRDRGAAVEYLVRVGAVRIRERRDLML